MIAVWISDTSGKETEYLCLCVKDAVGTLSDETLSLHKCVTIRELLALIGEAQKVDLACVDIAPSGALAAAEQLRGRYQDACLVLIASPEISPVRYMRPSIRAQGLILRPMQAAQVRGTVREAMAYVLKRYEAPDPQQYFVVDNEDGRELVPYSAICYFESRDKKIYLNTGAKEYGFYDTLAHLEEALGEKFLRCHRSFLVNREKILRVKLSSNQLVLTDGYQIPVSRSYKSVLREYGMKERGGRGASGGESGKGGEADG